MSETLNNIPGQGNTTPDNLTGTDGADALFGYGGDTTGNGTLSSLDASRIQQQVVGIPVDTFPNIG